MQLHATCESYLAPVAPGILDIGFRPSICGRSSSRPARASEREGREHLCSFGDEEAAKISDSVTLIEDM